MTESSPAPIAGAGAILTIDLDAIVANYRILSDRLHDDSTCAAVVKADAYGLGAERVAPVLYDAGCRHFYVALLDEAVALRGWLPDVEIYVLNGPFPSTEPVFHEQRLIPVLNDLGQIERWQEYCRQYGARPAVIHIDTGMNRLGLSPTETERLIAEPERLAGFELKHLMSHLVSAEIAGHDLNPTQLGRFRIAREGLPPTKAAFANSSGIFLGTDYHFHLARPGIALYGGNPTPGGRNPMHPVVRLDGRVVQVRDVDSPMTVGYGATHRVAEKGIIATISVGYADGYLRALSNRGTCIVGGIRVPVVGRVSMDLITVDVSNVPAQSLKLGDFVELLGTNQGIDDLAAECDTIGYEILTSLGRRYHRHYLGGTR